jgi:anti-sigma factor RsiW
MFSLFLRKKKACSNVLDISTDTVNAATLDELLDDATPQQRAHVAACDDCREALEELLATRLLLNVIPPQASVPRPWFASRVMSAIEGREAEFSRLATAWMLVPKLASRLAWVSAVAILVAGTWLYRKPASSPPGQTATEASVESVFETSPPPNQDDVLLGTVEKNR